MSAESLPKSIIGINFDPENNGLPVPKKVKDLFLDKAVYGLAGSAFKDVGLDPPRALLSSIVSHYCQQFPFFWCSLLLILFTIIYKIMIYLLKSF